MNAQARNTGVANSGSSAYFCGIISRWATADGHHWYLQKIGPARSRLSREADLFVSA
jgi:hypothetical protein